jgi:hypothetical protein
MFLPSESFPCGDEAPGLLPMVCASTNFTDKIFDIKESKLTP